MTSTARTEPGVAARTTTRLTYSVMQENINNLLNGTTPLSSLFTPQLLYRTTTNAGCYGPALLYQNHPDGSRTNNGTLPTGDLGIWQETDSASGHVCAAAQLNNRIRGMRDRSMAGLMVLASMIERVFSKGSTLPTSGHYMNLTSDMNVLAIPDVSFDFMLLSQDVSGMWNYDTEYTYWRSGVPYKVKLQATHNPDSSSAYNGLIQYQVQDTFSGGNCPTADITHQGSLVYTKNIGGDMQVEAREADFCGHSIATNSYISGGVLNSGDKYHPLFNADGWGNNYQQLTADYQPTSLSGQYSYVWQAGPDDSHSRIFNMRINDNDRLDGEAWFGFGVPVDNPAGTGTVGQITGFICNWAGPGSSHAESEYAQRQAFRYDETTGKFTVVSGGSDITYAPTNVCTYDGRGTFRYDRNLNHVLDIASTDIAIVKTTGASAGELTFDLFPASTSLYAGWDVETAIPARGYVAPTAPVSPLP